MSYQGAVNWLTIKIREAEATFLTTATDTKKNGKENTVNGAKGIAAARNYLLGLMTVWNILVDAPWVSDNQQVTDLLASTA